MVIGRERFGGFVQTLDIGHAPKVGVGRRDLGHVTKFLGRGKGPIFRNISVYRTQTADPIDFIFGTGLALDLRYPVLKFGRDRPRVGSLRPKYRHIIFAVAY